ncbi:DJ-1/PfpI family protein [Haloferacaceae archaeon DSL9]
MTTLAILLYDGFDELDAIGPFEVFQNAAEYGADIETALVTLEGRETVTASHGLRVEPDDVLPAADAPDRPDILLVPGGGWNNRAEKSAWAEAQKGAIPDAVAAYHDAGATLASVCTGGMLLATAGVTDGRRAVTHGSALGELRETDAEVVDARVVDDGDILTAGGVTSGIDLALHLVEREASADIADRVAATMEYERRTEPYRG